MLQKTIISYQQEESNLNIEALSETYETLCVFDSNKKFNSSQQIRYAQLIAIGAVRELVVLEAGNALTELQLFINQKASWLFGYLSYDLKNEIENLRSQNNDGLNIPVLHFFEPKFVLEVNENEIVIQYDDGCVAESDLAKLKSEIFLSVAFEEKVSATFEIKPRIEKSSYLNSVKELKNYIQLGDIYEVNFCQEFFAEKAKINPVLIYEKLNSISAAPFASFCKFNKHYLISASPERYIKKAGNQLVSQPIKGTAKRSDDATEDEQIKNELQNNPKEQNENVMIVDLVRNDLSKLATRGSVKVDELFGVYSFKQVHQLISTVSCEFKKDTSFTDIIKATFPMGSMTGAPKVSAMKLIEKFESTKRGLYSGSVGYIQPDGDFDFNVVIRSIIYDAKTSFLSFMVGSAITAKADPEMEYDECMLKAKAMFEVLQTNKMK
jgi:para-aminobenzoate synthetase component 1